MFIEIAALLSIFQLICAGVSTNLLFSNSENLTDNISDDMTLKDMQELLELLQTMNENLSDEINSLGLTLNYHLTEQRNEMKDDLEELKAALAGTQKLLRTVDSADPEYLFLNDDETTEKEPSEEPSAEPPEDVTPLSESATEKSEEETAQGNTEEPSEEPSAEPPEDVTPPSESATEKSSEEITQGTTKEPSEETDQSSTKEPSEETTQSTTKKPPENGDECEPMPKNCAEAIKASGRNGIYRIEVPDSGLAPFFVYCLKNNSIELSKRNEDNNGSGTTADPWMVIQRRQDGSIDFFLNWVDYQLGFGNIEGEFFIGLDKLHAITGPRIHELWIQMEDFEGGRRWAKYSTFAIGGESQGYALNVLGNYSGDAGDSLTIHEAQKWTTKDKDNDASKGRNCASTFTGAWWYNDCHESNLNGQYMKGRASKADLGKQILWQSWRGWLYSLKYVHMAIRPVPNRC